MQTIVEAQGRQQLRTSAAEDSALDHKSLAASGIALSLADGDYMGFP
jgi:hypothetical protein